MQCPEKSGLPDKSKFRILLVDVETPASWLAKSVIEGLGYTCFYAQDAPEALSRIESDQIHLVLSDIDMPDLPGLILANKVAQANPETLLAFMSGHHLYRALVEIVDLEPVGFIEKPVDPDELEKLLQRGHTCFLQEKYERETRRQLEIGVAEKTRELEFRTKTLAAEQKLMHGIISNANFGLVAVDPSGAVHLMNKLAAKLLGISDTDAEYFLGRPLLKMLPESLRPTINDLLIRIPNEGATGDKDGIENPDQRILHIISFGLYNKGTVHAVVLVIHDVTGEATLLKQVVQTAKLASIGELAAGVAHEINNPLGFVMSNCNSLTKYVDDIFRYISELEAARNLDPTADVNDSSRILLADLKKEFDIDYLKEDATSLLKETHDGLKRMSKIVLDLKTFARADSDQPQNAQINTLIEDALNLVRNETKYKMEIVTHFAELPEISCHPNQLVQVFTNIFVNAAQAVEDKGTLTITTSLMDDNVSISIKDNGPGIPPSVLEKIFDPFFTTKEPGKGTGMGLSISHGIIEKHGGTLSATSQVGDGTEFTIGLPTNSAADSEDKAESEACAV